jgi:large subunit ribosomal protein L21
LGETKEIDLFTDEGVFATLFYMEKQAVIKTGGKQYIVQEGDALTVERLPGQKGDTTSFSDVLLVADGEGAVSLGTPMLRGAVVEGEIIEQGKGKKVTVVKYKPKIRYHKKRGHRQHYTKVKIGKIGIGS